MNHAGSSVADDAAWRAALDAFAEALEAGRRALAVEADPSSVTDAGRSLEPAWPPPGLPEGPVPAGMRAEAEALLADADALRSEILTAMDRSRPPRRRPPAQAAIANARWSLDL